MWVGAPRRRCPGHEMAVSRLGSPVNAPASGRGELVHRRKGVRVVGPEDVAPRGENLFEEGSSGLEVAHFFERDGELVHRPQDVGMAGIKKPRRAVRTSLKSARAASSSLVSLRVIASSFIVANVWG